MHMIRYRPWNLAGQLHNEIHQLFDGNLAGVANENGLTASDWVPAVDIKEEDQRFVIHADVPGVDPEGHRDHHGRRHPDPQGRAPQ